MRVAADTPVAVLVVAGLLPEFLLPVVLVLVQMPQPRRDLQGLSCRR
jgi:hypothetical protein